MENFYEQVLDSQKAQSGFTMMILTGLAAAILLSAGITLLLVTPGAQPVSAVIAVVMIALGVGVAINCFVACALSFKYRQKPLDASHRAAISSLIKERGAILNNQAAPDHHNRAE